MLTAFLERLGGAVGRYFLWLVIGLSALAFFAPAPFVTITPYVTYLLGIIMLGMGMTLTPRDFHDVFQRPRDITIGVAAQYLIMPLLGFFIARILRLPPDLAAGLVLVGCCPSGTASNVMTYMSEGDLALSVSVTSMTTLLAPVLTPYLTLLLAGEWIPVPAERLLVEILKIVILPVIAGVGLRALFSRRIEKLLRIFPLLSASAIIAIIMAIVAINSSRLLTEGIVIFAAVILHNLAGFGLGFQTAKAFGLEPRKVKAITYEVGMQNSGLAAALALKYFSPVAAIPGAIFSVWHNVAAAALVSRWVKKR